MEPCRPAALCLCANMLVASLIQLLQLMMQITVLIAACSQRLQELFDNEVARRIDVCLHASMPTCCWPLAHLTLRESVQGLEASGRGRESDYCFCLTLAARRDLCTQVHEAGGRSSQEASRVLQWTPEGGGARLHGECGPEQCHGVPS